MDLVVVGCEVDHSSLAFLEKGCVRVPVFLVLAHCVLPGLAGHGVLQLASGYWYSVEGKHQVNGVTLVRMTWDLPGDGEPVGVVIRHRAWVEVVGRLEERDLESLPRESEPVA